VVVGTLPGREEALKQCLAAINAQTKRPDQILVLRDMPSMLAVIREGLRRAGCEWVAFIDDDAVPASTWLETLSRHFGDAAVGAVGGRIVNVVDGQPTARSFSRGAIARVSWYGRTVEHLNHVPVTHVVADVAFLRGSNVCFRRAAMPAIDARIDVGMSPGNEVALCLDLQERGWRVRFDSDAVVTHYPAPRPDRIAREDMVRHVREYSHVVTFTLLRYSRWPRKLTFLAYFFLIGQRASPGVAFALFSLRTARDRAVFRAAWVGKLRGLKAAIQ
jgi:GT2 family glycosyltransferase